MLLLTAALVAAGAVLVTAGSIPVLAALLVTVGLFLAPALVTGYLLADLLVAAAARTEASTWVATACNAGASLGAALAGLVVDHRGVPAALATGAALAAGCTALAGTRIRSARR